MVAIYVRWIKLGKLTIEDVPEKWRNEVEQKLNQDSSEEG